jgi:hypothetical protein
VPSLLSGQLNIKLFPFYLTSLLHEANGDRYVLLSTAPTIVSITKFKLLADFTVIDSLPFFAVNYPLLKRLWQFIALRNSLFPNKAHLLISCIATTQSTIDIPASSLEILDVVLRPIGPLSSFSYHRQTQSIFLQLIRLILSGKQSFFTLTQFPKSIAKTNATNVKYSAFHLFINQNA